jgi:hypothetical protein
MTAMPNKDAANGGGLPGLRSARLVAAVAELGSLVATSSASDIQNQTTPVSMR